MGIFEKLFGRAKGKRGEARHTRTKDPDQLYKHALELFRKEKFREAAEVLEETAGINPNSARVHFTLGGTYSRIAGEYRSDEDKLRAWAKKSVDCFRKAVGLASQYGGLNEGQLSMARDAVTAFDKIMAKESPSLPEDQRRKIFADFMKTQDTELLFGTNIAQELYDASSFEAMQQSVGRSGAQADAATYAKICNKYGLSEGQLRAIVEEGKAGKWPFRGVTR